MKQCFFKKEAVKQKKLDGWKLSKVSESNKKKDKRQGITLMEKH